MSIINQNLLLTPEGYQISRSVRLRSSASAYFNRTFGAPTSGTTWTWSGWVKRGALGSLMGLQHAYSATNNQGGIYFSSTGDTLSVLDYPTSVNCSLVTTQVFRDSSAWYHIIVAVDTTQATASNRVKVYVNGVQVTSFSTATYPTQNTTFRMVASGNSGSVGRYYDGTSYYLDGYLTEINFIDGQALTPSSFGETDSITGVWKPKKYAGTYGTNGFYLNFSDNSNNTAATIGKDYSGNGNNWTPNNISVTSGVTYDSMLDVPTPYADGGNGRGNYCVLNPLATQSNAVTLSNANLTMNLVASGNAIYYGTIGAAANAYYFETTITNLVSGGDGYVGIYDSANNGAFANCVYRVDGTIFNGSGFSAYGASYTTGDVIGVAYDLNNNTITFYKNNVSQGQKTIVSGKTVIPAAYISYSSSGTVWSLNFGQRPFAYTPPTGFVALNTQNLPDATIKKGNQYFDATTYTGNAGSLTVSNGNFQPDLIWAKPRSVANWHGLWDSVRGGNNLLYSNGTDAEAAVANLNMSVNSTGWSMNGNNSSFNPSGATIVGWQWQAGQGSTSSNTSGSITSTVSVNATAGFSVVTYTGTGANATVGHGLGVAPKMIICKSRSNAYNWVVYHASIGNTQNLKLNLTDAATVASTSWNNTSPTSSVFSLGSSLLGNDTGSMVAYCWSEIAGFSRFGSYTGNGSADGPFVYCGFRPRWIMFKRTDGAGNWFIRDTARNQSNGATASLFPNLSDAEGTGAEFDILSNGFKVRSSASGVNGSGETLIFAAFAENPFKNSLAR